MNCHPLMWEFLRGKRGDRAPATMLTEFHLKPIFCEVMISTWFEPTHLAAARVVMALPPFLDWIKFLLA